MKREVVQSCSCSQTRSKWPWTRERGRKLNWQRDGTMRGSRWSQKTQMGQIRRAGVLARSAPSPTRYVLDTHSCAHDDELCCRTLCGQMSRRTNPPVLNAPWSTSAMMRYINDSLILHTSTHLARHRPVLMGVSSASSTPLRVALLLLLARKVTFSLLTSTLAFSTFVPWPSRSFLWTSVSKTRTRMGQRSLVTLQRQLLSSLQRTSSTVTS